jgi:NADH-quinone oxidoreductase subunit N
LILAATLAVALLAHGQLRRQERPEEFYLLLLLGAAGAQVLAAAAHVASLVLGLELLSTALYALIAYRRPGPRGVEAGLQYLVLAVVAIAILLFGAALLYFEFGTLRLADLSAALARGPASPLAAAGLALVVIGAGFKLSLVPMHLWAADVFAGAPEPVAAFVATASKGAVAVVLLRLAAPPGAPLPAPIIALLAALAALSMLGGNLVALRQRDPRRMLAGSSIAHMGYLLVAVLAAGPRRVETAAFYLAAYFAATLGAFGVLAALAGRAGGRGPGPELAGLFPRRPFLAFVLAVSLLSLAGLPLTGGFIGKIYVIGAGVEAGLRAPVAALIAGSVLGLFYYVPPVAAMLAAAGDAGPRRFPAFPRHGYAVLAALAAAILWLGADPAPLQALLCSLGPAGF